MRISGARMFSKSFGGKIEDGSTAVATALVKTKNLHTVECIKYLIDYTLLKML